jgi:hypothetical protein
MRGRSEARQDRETDEILEEHRVGGAGFWNES